MILAHTFPRLPPKIKLRNSWQGPWSLKCSLHKLRMQMHITELECGRLEKIRKPSLNVWKILGSKHTPSSESSYWVCSAELREVILGARPGEDGWRQTLDAVNSQGDILFSWLGHTYPITASTPCPLSSFPRLLPFFPGKRSPLKLPLSLHSNLLPPKWNPLLWATLHFVALHQAHFISTLRAACSVYHHSLGT